ncbi:hypothetical protein COU75_01820 [Candidatus Peregrinibacteria bacterium CG10_big_fil_rev_8_21_14_0_10_42_8]|nr:MAG: hypothetical protein COU75_01820 [Candidatus Peregrinibacteria bacterium CG10_big_fil_rev_8_21_14_0_10_42_8]
MSEESTLDDNIEPDVPFVIDEDLARRNQATGKELDILCTGGNTTFLDVHREVSQEVANALSVTAYIIPKRSGSIGTKERKNPREIAIGEYNPKQHTSYFKQVKQYGETHANDTAPRFFGMVNASDLPHFLQKQALAMAKLAGRQEEEGTVSPQALDLPLFTMVSAGTAKEYVSKPFFNNVTNGVTHGIITQNTDDAERVNSVWNEYREDLARPELHARPFMGLQMPTDDLIAFLLKNTDIQVDTIIPTDTPTLEQAKRIHELRIGKMKKQKTATMLENPFSVEGRTTTQKVAVINVQGSARKDAIALLEASEGIDDFNVEVHLVENGVQMKGVEPDIIVFPGGWHKMQFDNQKELGINDEIVSEIRSGVHVLALCAGSIQTRTAAREDLLYESQSDGCAPGTTFGLGGYSVINNALSNPHHILCKLHRSYNPNDKKVRIFQNIPLSNAPYFYDVDRDTMDIIARLSTSPWAESIDDEDGHVVGVKVKQKRGVDPVQIAASFHDKIIFTLFLHEVALWQEEARHNKKMNDLKRSFQDREWDL